MRHRKTKIFFAWQHEKEEAWLNQMSAMGLQLVGVNFPRYTFEEGAPGEYAYRLELLEHWPGAPESAAYIRFLEETGVEHIGSVLRWVYFRKKVADGPFDLYSDIDSRLRHYGRIRLMLGVVGVANLPLVTRNICHYFEHHITVVLVLSLLQLLMIGVLFYGVFNISRKVARLKKDRQFRE